MQNLKVTQAQDETMDPRPVKKQCFLGSPVDKALYKGPAFKSKYHQSDAIVSLIKAPLHPDSQMM